MDVTEEPADVAMETLLVHGVVWLSSKSLLLQLLTEPSECM